MEELFSGVDEHEMLLATLAKMKELWPNYREEEFALLHQRASLLVVDDMINEFILSGKAEVAGIDNNGQMAYRVITISGSM